MSEERQVPDVDELARSMLAVHGAHDDHTHSRRVRLTGEGRADGSAAGGRAPRGHPTRP